MYKVLRTSPLSFYLKILQEKYNTLWNGIGIEINTLQGEKNKTLLESADLVWSSLVWFHWYRTEKSLQLHIRILFFTRQFKIQKIFIVAEIKAWISDI